MATITAATAANDAAAAYQRLRGHLAYLGLKAAADALPGLLDEARDGRLSLLDALERLMGTEAAAAESRKLASRLHWAALPAPWRIEDYDFAAQPGADEAVIRELATLRFIDEAANVLFVGPPGTGKTMLSAGLARAAAEAGRKVLFTTCEDLVRRLRRAAAEHRTASGLHHPSKEVRVKDAQKPDHISLSTLIGRLKEGRFVIPDFQREFEWTPQDIRDLMRSIFLDYYIGSLLLWKGKPENFTALSCESIYGYSGAGGSPEHIVLDGQQRLTAMYYAFVAPNAAAPNRANRYVYFIQVQHFMGGAYDEAFHYDWTKAGLNLKDDRTAQFDTHMFPLSVVGSGGWDLPNWVQGYEAYWREKADKARASDDGPTAESADHCADDAKASGEHLKGIIEQYQIAYVELDRDLALDKVCDIFTQVNSKGIRLDVFDLINALVKPMGLQLKHMWHDAAPKLEFVDTGRMNVYILQVMSILRQAYCSPKYLYYLLPGQEKTVRDQQGVLSKQVLVPGTTDFQNLWATAVDALQAAIGLLRHPQEFGAGRLQSPLSLERVNGFRWSASGGWCAAGRQPGPVSRWGHGVSASG